MMYLRLFLATLLLTMSVGCVNLSDMYAAAKAIGGEAAQDFLTRSGPELIDTVTTAVAEGGKFKEIASKVADQTAIKAAARVGGHDWREYDLNGDNNLSDAEVMKLGEAAKEKNKELMSLKGLLLKTKEGWDAYKKEKERSEREGTPIDWTTLLLSIGGIGAMGGAAVGGNKYLEGRAKKATKAMKAAGEI